MSPRIEQNYPNPCNGTTILPVTVNAPGTVEVSVINILGQVVRVLYSGPVTAGRHFYVWDGKNGHGNDVPSGVYYARGISSGNLFAVRKMLVIR